MAIVKLTQDFINNQLVCPAGVRRAELVSDERTGLYIELRDTCKGIGTYYFRFKSGGKTCHQKIARTTEMSLADAKKRVIELKAEIASGTDPRSEAKTSKGVETLDDLWLEYQDFAKSTVPRSFKRLEQLWRIRIRPRMAHLNLRAISPRLIQTLMMDLRKEGLSAASADHHGGLLRRMGNMAVKWGYIPSNFAAGVQLYHEFNGVENVLSDQQLQNLINVLNTDENRHISRLALFLLSTGARLNEALSAQWKNVSVENRLWIVPHESSKSKRLRSIPLNDSALEVLQQIDRKESDVYVFTNRKTGTRFVNVFKPWNRIRTKAGVPFLRMHDLRHMYASYCVNNGRTIYEVSQLLGHADTRTTVRYAHLSSKTLMEAANSVSDKLSEVMRIKSDVEVKQEAA